MVNPPLLRGKTILITGASSGIGRATAVHSSKLGARVVMIARNEEKLQAVLEELEGKDHKWYSYDLKGIEGIEGLIKTVVNENGPLNGFVHSAGVSLMRPLKMTTYDFIHEMMLINFYSFVEIVRYLSKKGRYREGMSIVGMSSVSSIRGFKSKTAYSASKAAMDGAIRSMAKELGDKKIRINSIVAGFVKTEMFDRFAERTGSTESDNQFSAYCLGLGEPYDVANAVAFLLSDESRIITGTGLVIDSGATS
ncbi:SDR family NAD(P)-dependent oxidoreductase [Mesotoga sp. UBA5847]|jgi:NAD(P)-dependent dehydrogenase (short-subunit alcohol dehydrogenase family)|uniref:SDR family NAD(P)-dependent oxidoreductase n=1 Tax=Mesotoga sp. UBA5847 TaxID=1946859 RepID=UPI0025D8AE32|nr:SDR family oxidoreductase [Mesotoga sp. UBA5847]